MLIKTKQIENKKKIIIKILYAEDSLLFLLLLD